MTIATRKKTSQPTKMDARITIIPTTGRWKIEPNRNNTMALRMNGNTDQNRKSHSNHSKSSFPAWKAPPLNF
jgi:hypothetical protein